MYYAHVLGMQIGAGAALTLSRKGTLTLSFFHTKFSRRVGRLVLLFCVVLAAENVSLLLRFNVSFWFQASIRFLSTTSRTNILHVISDSWIVL